MHHHGALIVVARIFRTEDGQHVPEGDEDAAFLAFGDGDEVPAEVLAEVSSKASKPSANKARSMESKS